MKRTEKFVKWFQATQIGGDIAPQSNKSRFKLDGKHALKLIADALGLGKEKYDLRFNAGGSAVSGEVTLHTDYLYIQISQNWQGHEILARYCEGRKDYYGGANNFFGIDSLVNGKLLTWAEQTKLRYIETI